LFRDPYNNFNVAGLSSSFSGGPAGKESGSAETIHKAGRLTHGLINAQSNIAGEHYNFTNGVGEFIANTLDFSGALGYVKTAPYYRANKIANKNPWYDSYEDYIEDVRVFGKDYGVLAEFNMSENMDEYAQYNFDYTKPNPGLFTLRGQGSMSSSLYFPPGTSILTEQYKNTGVMREQFLRRYCISDSMDYMHNKVGEDISSGTGARPRAITLRFDAVTKLMPYYGFYPVTRTMQLATLFSQSIGPFLSCSLDNLSVNKKTYLGYHHSKEVWEHGDAVSGGISFTPAGTYVERGAEFITASAHPTYELMGSKGTTSYPVDGLSYGLKDGVHFSTRLFDLADAGHEGAKGWKQALIDVHQAGKMQSMLQPTFAPGIMYNTIKSGVAVDYPIYINQREPAVTPNVATEVGSGIKIKDHTDGAILIDAPNYRLPFETLYDLSNIPSAPPEGLGEVPKIYYTEPTWHMCGTDDQGNAKLGKEMAGSFYAAWTGERGPLYEKAANNFLSEIPNFFLKNSGLTSFTSARSSQIKPMVRDRTYLMNVSIEIFDQYRPGGPSAESPQAGSEFVMAEGPRKPLVPITDRQTQYQPLPRRGSIFGPALLKWSDKADASNGKSWTGGPTATGSILTVAGDNVAGGAASSSLGTSYGTSGELYNLTSHETDPCYAPYTPPYYYGKAVYKMAYTHQPDAGSQLGNLVAEVDGALGAAPMQAAIPTLEEIITNIQTNSVSEEYNLFDRPVYYRDDGTPVLAKDVALTLDSSSPSTGSRGHTAYKHRMKVSSSLDLFKIKEVLFQAPDGSTKKEKVWEISTKFECPVINLAESSYVGTGRHRPDLTHEQQKDNANKGYFSDRTGRSIWMGYSNTDNVDGFENETTTLSDGTVVSFPRRGVKITLSDATNNPEESLLNVAGFRNGPNVDEEQELSKYIGQIANSKTVTEAIVAIPFLENELPGVTYSPFTKYGVNIHFIKIHPDEYYAQYENFVSGKPAVHTDLDAQVLGSKNAHSRMDLTFPPEDIGETSISRMINMMDQYVIPPELDFYHRGIGSKDLPSGKKYLLTRQRFMNNQEDGIDPFIMYIHEFSRQLDNKDLGDIWQNLLPDAGMRAQKEASVLSHAMAGPRASYEFWGRLDHLNTKLAEGQWEGNHRQENINKNSKTLKKIFGPTQQYGGVKWLIFKVKKRANMSMRQLKNRNEVSSLFQVDNVGNLAGGSSVSEDVRLQSRYNYNWPYDFFSLVETAKLSVEYEL